MRTATRWLGLLGNPSMWALLLAIAAGGCGGGPMQGARPHSGLPPEPLARFTIPSCTMSTGAVVPGPANRSYYLVREPSALVLYEIDALADGAIITNHWVDDRGDVFFAWVEDGDGWAYVFPREASRAPQQILYTAGEYEVSRRRGATVPVGRPAGTCALVAN